MLLDVVLIVYFFCVLGILSSARVVVYLVLNIVVPIDKQTED